MKSDNLSSLNESSWSLRTYGGGKGSCSLCTDKMIGLREALEGVACNRSCLL